MAAPRFGVLRLRKHVFDAGAEKAAGKQSARDAR
jgi:hypothetical protein